MLGGVEVGSGRGASVKEKNITELKNWGCAEGVEKASCGETVQKGVLESPFLLFPLKVFRCFQGKPYWGREETDSPKTPFWTTVSPHDAFSALLARSERMK